MKRIYCEDGKPVNLLEVEYTAYCRYLNDWLVALGIRSRIARTFGNMAVIEAENPYIGHGKADAERLMSEDAITAYKVEA